MAITDAHPRPDELIAFGLGTLGDELYATLETHVATCPDCQEKVGSVPGDSLVELLKAARSRLSPPAEPTDATQAQTPSPLLAKEVTLSQVQGTVHPRLGPSNGATQMDLVPPELASHDRYRIVRQLGVGGMGAVYEAEHRVMQRRVALKFIKPDLTVSATVVERFRREVRAAARLTHPNIVATYDAEDAGATQFLVMEYAEGTNLAQLVQERGPLPVIEACSYVRQAALGLQHAHEHGMVHRDVKPANLIRCNDGVVKVLDFGLATLTAQQDANLTDDNAVMGTPNYMAPEQAESARNADIRADVYSLGCTLFHLLAGDVPFPTGTTVQKILAHREQAAPSIRAVRPDVPPELAAIVTRLLAKKPDDRFQTPGEVAAALEPFAKPAPAQPPRKRRPLVFALAAALFAGIVMAGGVVYRIQTDNGVLEIKTESDDVEVIVKQGGKLVEIMDAKTKKKMTLRSGVYDLELKDGKGLKLDITKATLTRGETVLATIERLPKVAKIETRPKAAPPSNADPSPEEEKVGEVRQVVGHSQEIHPVAFSPDGGMILTGACVDTRNTPGDCYVQLWDAATGKELRRLKGHRAGIASAAFSRDGKRIVAGGYAPDPSITVWDVKSGEVLHRFTNSLSRGWGTVENVAFSKDGRYVFSCGVDPTRRASTLRMWNLETGKEAENHFDEHATRMRGLAVSHNGRLLACGIIMNEASVIRLWDIETGKLMKQFAGDKKETQTHSIVFSLDDTQLISGGHDFGLHLWDVRTGEEIPRFDSFTDRVTSVDISPDGRRVACGYGPPPTVGIWDLETGKEIHRFTGHTRNVLNVAFSPDGRHVLSSGGADNTARLWRLPPAPGEPKTPLTPPQPKVTEIQLLHRVPIPGRWDYFTTTAVTDDGKFFAADILEKDARNKEVVVFDGKTGTELYRIPGWYCRITPDGKRLVCTDEVHAVHVHDLASGKKLQIIQLRAHFYGYTLLPDSRHARAWTKGDLTHLCDLDNGKIVKTWRNASFGSCTDDGRILLVKPAGEQRFIAWDVQKREPTTELAHLTKYPHAGHLFPGSKQALVSSDDGKNLVLDLADGKTAPFPVRSWPPFVRGPSAQLDIRINLLEDGNARYCTFDYLTGKETAAIQLPKGERFDRGDPITLSPKGGCACAETNKAVYLLRLVAGK